jgi:hypothetical protein
VTSPQSEPRSRLGEDVWRQIQHICKERMVADEPVLTLTRSVANTITDVADDRIGRHSAESRSEAGQDADVPKSQVLAIWDQLARTGSSTGTSSSVLYFAYALVALVPGIGVRGPRDLYFSDRDLAMKPFRRPPALVSGGAPLARASRNPS